MLTRLLIVSLILFAFDFAAAGRNKWNKNGKFRRGKGGRNIRIGSDKDYLWSHDLSDDSISDRKDLEFHVSDGRDKIVTWDGVFSQNGEILATDGIWLNKKKFVVYVPKWKGWWVGKVIFNKKDNVRGMKTMFIASETKTVDPPKACRNKQPQHLEKGDLLFRTLIKSTDMNDVNDNEGGETCGASTQGKGGKGKNGKHGKHHDHGHHHDHHHHGHHHGHYWHEHGHDHHGHRCCGIIGRTFAVVGGLLIVGLCLLGVFRAIFDDVFADCCLLSVMKIKLDIENREFRITWKNKNDGDENNKDKGKSKSKRKSKNKNDSKMKNDEVVTKHKSVEGPASDDEQDAVNVETSNKPLGGEE